jgi:hypothetical protein
MAKKKQPARTLCWFEIPAKKMERAVKFYEAVFDVKLEVMEMGPCQMAMFPGGDGALVSGNGVAPAAKGALVYFDCEPDLKKAQGRVAKAGGEILQKRMSIGPHGFIAVLKDTEGNRIGIHSRK